MISINCIGSIILPYTFHDFVILLEIETHYTTLHTHTQYAQMFANVSDSYDQTMGYRVSYPSTSYIFSNSLIFVYFINHVTIVR